MPENPVTGVNVQNNNQGYEINTGNPAALWQGAGTSAAPVDLGSVVNKNFVGMWTKSSAASGDTRQMYLGHTWTGAAGGEVLRLYAKAGAAGVAATATMNGLHATAAVLAASTIATGAANGVRATIATATTTPSGTGAALQVDSDFVTSATIPAPWAFIRVTQSGSTDLTNLFNLPAPSTGGVFATHTTQTAMTHSIKIVANGTPYYIMCTSTGTNRS